MTDRYLWLVKFRRETSLDVFGTSYRDSEIFTYQENPVAPGKWVHIRTDSHGANWELMIEGENDSEEDYNPCIAQTWSTWGQQGGRDLSAILKDYENFTHEFVYVNKDNSWTSVIDGKEMAYSEADEYLFYRNYK